MPLWLRKFTFNKLKDYFNKQNNQDNALVNADPTNLPTVHQPGVAPSGKSTYNTKVSKK